jgi:hypothetical protein
MLRNRAMADGTAGTPIELLAARLAALPTRQLEGLRRAIEGSMGYATALMSWMRDLVLWETARRQRLPATVALPRLDAIDIPTATLTLSVLAVVFQASPIAGVDAQPTLDLLRAIEQTLRAYAAGDLPPLQ